MDKENLPCLSLRFIFSLLMILYLSACSTPPKLDEAQVEDKLVFYEAQKVVVLPIFSLVKEFRQYTPLIHQTLVDSLSARGFDCFVIGEKQYLEMRKKALQESGSIYNPGVGEFIPFNEDVYIADFVQQLTSVGDFNLLLFPELLLRTAMVNGDFVAWDGTNQPLIVKGNADGNAKIPKIARGLSLKVVAYTIRGERRMEQFGGLAVPYYLDLTSTPASFKLRDNLMEQEKLLKGVQRVIAPLGTIKASADSKFSTESVTESDDVETLVNKEKLDKEELDKEEPDKEEPDKEELDKEDGDEVSPQSKSPKRKRRPGRNY